MSLQQDSARVPNPTCTPVARTCPQCGGPLHYEGLTHVECLTRDCANFVEPVASPYTANWVFGYEQALLEHARGNAVECQGERDPDSVWQVCNPEHERVYGPCYRWRLARIQSTDNPPPQSKPFAPLKP